jgi:hypothetical protein
MEFEAQGTATWAFTFLLDGTALAYIDQFG